MTQRSFLKIQTNLYILREAGIIEERNARCVCRVSQQFKRQKYLSPGTWLFWSFLYSNVPLSDSRWVLGVQLLAMYRFECTLLFLPSERTQTCQRQIYYSLEPPIAVILDFKMYTRKIFTKKPHRNRNNKPYTQLREWQWRGEKRLNSYSCEISA